MIKRSACFQSSPYQHPIYDTHPELLNYPWVGVLDLTIFRTDIPLFTSAHARAKCFEILGVDLIPEDKELLDNPEQHQFYEGCVSYGWTKDNTYLLALYLSPESGPSTWVHEASHCIDLVFERVGIPPGVESTEVRSYCLDHLYTQISQIMEEQTP